MRHAFNNPHPRPAAPKVSVCLITYNHGRFIDECLASLVSQEVDFEWEIIVSDDLSTDGAAQIIARYEERHPALVFSIRNESKLGGTANYRQLHAAARGEFIAHVDGDDFWHPGKLAAQVRFLDREPGCAAVFTNASVVDAEGRPLGQFSSGVPASFDIDFLISRGNFLTHSSMMYRRALQAEIFPATAEFIDLQVYIRLLKFGKLGFIDERLVTYRIQAAASATSASNEKIRALYWQALLDVERTAATAKALRSATIHFLAGAMQRELSNRTILGYGRWLRMVQQSSTQRIPLLSMRALAVMVLNVSKGIAIKSAMALRILKSESRILYPR